MVATEVPDTLGPSFSKPHCHRNAQQNPDWILENDSVGDFHLATSCIGMLDLAIAS